jgi:hypothetical protein
MASTFLWRPGPGTGTLRRQLALTWDRREQAPAPSAVRTERQVVREIVGQKFDATSDHEPAGSLRQSP